jgi:hypothetical protein
MKRILPVILATIFVLCICGAGWGGDSFTVLGTSEQKEDAQPPTLEMAIQDGLIRAVEEAVRSMVASQTVEKRQGTLAREFYQKADSFVLSYKILEKTVLPTGYQTVLEVVVDTQGIEKRLSALGLLGRTQRPALRTIRLVVSGVRSYSLYTTIEHLLQEDPDVQAFSLSEIEPTKFTWQVRIKGETGRLANRLLYHDFGDFKAQVMALKSERLEIVLSR